MAQELIVCGRQEGKAGQAIMHGSSYSATCRHSHHCQLKELIFFYKETSLLFRKYFLCYMCLCLECLLSINRREGWFLSKSKPINLRGKTLAWRQIHSNLYAIQTESVSGQRANHSLGLRRYRSLKLHLRVCSCSWTVYYRSKNH